MRNGRTVHEVARDLVGTSVQDLQSSLSAYTHESNDDIEIIKHAIGLTQRRGEKTKTQILQHKLRKMYKELQDAKTYKPLMSDDATGPIEKDLRS